jgi:E3 ubiquitin-protein ligase DOA10
MIDHLREAHRIDKDDVMDTEGAVNQRIDKVFGKATKRIEFNLDMFKQLLLRWIIINHIAFHQVEDAAFRTLLRYLLTCLRLDSFVQSIISSQWQLYRHSVSRLYLPEDCPSKVS